MQIKDINAEALTIADNDFFVIQSEGITKRVKASVLKTYFGTQSTPTPTPTPTPTEKTLTYVSDGDSNDLFYWLGTAKGATSWVNPQSNGSLIVTASSVAA